ncbi:MAG: hypothetical protein FWF94_03420 [Oscillospiraceae bacterium]|nr:hypothetical protein [Oscillospiraceae bacterium]
MKTVLIDKSLTKMKFNHSFGDDNDIKRMLFMYVCALTEAGASYIEVDFDTIVRLPKPSGAENYIFRIGRPEEFVVANALSFAYAVIPLRFSYILPKIEIPAILEIDTGDSDIFEVLQIVSSNIDLSPYSMIRITGNFDSDIISSVIGNYRRKTIIPIDICPKNNRLSALNSAISAVIAESDSVTARFGDSNNFASLEEVLIMLSSLHRIIVSPNYLEGICKASLFLSMLSTEADCSNLTMMMKKYMYGTHRIENIDAALNKDEIELRQLLGSRIRSDLGKTPVRMNSAERVLNSLGLEKEISEQIVKVIDNCNVKLFKGINDENDKKYENKDKYEAANKNRSKNK